MAFASNLRGSAAAGGRGVTVLWYVGTSRHKRVYFHSEAITGGLLSLVGMVDIVNVWCSTAATA
jgi:hypothetical protein